MRGLFNAVLFVAVVCLVVGLASMGHATGGGGEPGLTEIATALESSETEIRGPIFSAVVGILTAILVIGVAAGVVRVIRSNT